MSLIRSLIKADAVGSRGCAKTPRFFLRVEMQTTDQVAGLIIEVGEGIGIGLLQRHWKSFSVLSRRRNGRVGTLLRCSTKDARERRRGAPNRLDPSILILPPLQTSETVRVLRLRLLHT